RGKSVFVVQSTQDWDLPDHSALGSSASVRRLVRDPLANSLVRSSAVKVIAIPIENGPKVLLAENDHVIEALATDAAQESLANRVRVRIGVRKTVIPVPSATASKDGPNLSSLSRIRKRGPLPHSVASRSCCFTHALVGERVTAECTTLREPSSMKKNAK